MTDMSDYTRNRYIVPGLERGLKLLGSFTRERPEAGVGELAREHDLPRTTVFRLLHTLEANGFVTRVPGGKQYRLGSAVMNLGFEFLSTLELPDVARPILEALRDDTGASAHLSIREGDEIVYVSRYASRSALTSNIRVGSRLPAHASSMGRAMLACLPRGELEALYDDRPLSRYTDQTPGDLAALLDLLEGDRQRGFVVSRSYYERGVISIAAPVLDHAGRAVAAINITAAEQSLDWPAREGFYVDCVRRAARDLADWVGDAVALEPNGVRRAMSV